jgi:hypothetical protein
MAFEDSLITFMSSFLHLASAHLDFRFAEPPDPTVREAQARSTNDFFISYRHRESEDYARGLVNELEALGYRVYFAGAVPELALMDDTQLQSALRRALHTSSVLTIIGSNDALGGEWVRWESETFDEGHWGRQVPIITSEIGSDGQTLVLLRRFHTSAATIYEEDEGAWESRKPSATTIFCMVLVREFFRVELDFWHRCAHISAEDRPRAYIKALYDDKVCRVFMHAMLWPNREYSLAQLRKRYLKDARHRGPTIWRRLRASFGRSG